MIEIFTLLLVLHLHEMMCFSKMSKTHYKNNILSPFKNIDKNKSRKPCILRHIRAVPTSTPFAPFRLQTPPLSPFPLHDAKHMVFSTQDGPQPPKVLEIYHFYYAGEVGGHAACSMQHAACRMPHAQTVTGVKIAFRNDRGVQTVTGVKVV